METVLVTVGLIFVLIWAFRLEIGIAKANETLRRIEKKLGVEEEKK